MNAERLLAHYERIADAPDAIARLRRFVLDLAVRGKLAPQDASDEPALELLKRIAKEKARLVKVGEIKPQKPSPATAKYEASVGLTIGWAAACLADITVCLDYRREPINGAERDKRIEGKSPDDLYPYYGATQQQGWIDDYLFDEELVLLGEDGVPFFDPLRSKAYLISGRTWVNNHAHVFKGILISHAFLVHYLNVFDYSGRVVGATRSKLNQARALDIPVPLPPLAEQRRIVAKVDELMALCDRLEAARANREATRDRLAAASLARLNAPDLESFQADARFALDALPALTTRPDQIKALRQTILNLAVRGKLVPQDASDEPASELLKRIAKEKARLVKAGKVKKGAVLQSALNGEPGFPTPTGWTWTTVGAVSNVVMGQSPPGDTYNITGNGVPLINGPVEFSAGPFGRTVVHQYTTAPTNFCEEGDLLICVRGSTTGRTNVAGFRACIGRGVAAIQPYFEDAFVRLFIWNARDAIIDMGRGIAFPSVSRKQIEDFALPLPPLAEQHRIVAKVDELMALCDRLEASLATADITRRRLLDALLAEVLAPADARELEAAERAVRRQAMP